MQALANIGSWEWDLSQERMVWSDELCRIFAQPSGFSPTFDEFLGLVHPEDRHLVRGAVEDTLTGEVHENEYRIVRPDGAVRVLRSRRIGRLDAAGRVCSLFGTNQDITELRIAQDARREAQELFETAFADAPIGMALVSLDGHFLKVNSMLCEVTGYVERDLLERTFQDITHPEDLDDDLEHLRGLLAGELSAYRMEKRYIRGSGEEIWVHLSVSLVRDPAGRPRYFVSQIEDISQRKADERALREAQAWLQAVFDHVPAGMTLRGLDGRYVYINRAAAAAVGRTPEEIVGQLPQVILGSATGVQMESDDTAMRASREPIVREFTLPRPDGTERAYHIISYPVLGSGAEVIGFGTFSLDITDRKLVEREREQTLAELHEAEQEAQRQRDYAQTIIGSTREGFMLTVDGEVLDVNSALCEMTGFERQELVGATVPYPFWAPEALEAINQHRVAVGTGSAPRELETTYLRSDGTRINVSVTTEPARFDRGGSTAYVSTIRDITAQTRHEAELQRLATRDSLTGLLNQRVFHERLQDEIARARRYNRPLSIAILDLDHFKDVNDRYGHPVGDEVLRAAAKRLQALTRDGEHLARIGGEEFGWILPDANADGAYAAAERARHTITAIPFPRIGSVTLSAGVCVLTDADDGDLYKHADRALYAAKQQGRNRTILYTRQIASEPSVEPGGRTV
jgi:diguanylate cyclase (GGDEF)-like protein/PAS domain S-box-containing protein